MFNLTNVYSRQKMMSIIRLFNHNCTLSTSSPCSISIPISQQTQQGYERENFLVVKPVFRSRRGRRRFRPPTGRSLSAALGRRQRSWWRRRDWPSRPRRRRPRQPRRAVDAVRRAGDRLEHEDLGREERLQRLHRDVERVQAGGHVLRQRRPPPLFLGPLRRPRSIDTFRLSVAVAAAAAATVPPPVSVSISAVVFFTPFVVEVFVTIPGMVRRRGVPRAGSGAKGRSPRVPLLASCLGYLEEDEEPGDLNK